MASSDWDPSEYPTSRSLLVSELADQLARDRAPRLQLLIIMSLAGGAGFLASFLLLWWGGSTFDRMALRYAVAALTGYATFIALVRLWIAFHRPSHGFDVDAGDVAVDVLESAIPVPSSTSPAVDIPIDIPLELEARGNPTEADTWRAVRRSVMTSREDGNAFIDFDDCGWLVVAGVCAVGGLIAVAYVVYIAPVLLAEVALDAAIISALYRRLRRDEAGHWLTTVLTRTWLPATAVVLFAAIAGFALQQVAPEAQSIGGVIRAFRN
jgi:hypothetical protein